MRTIIVRYGELALKSEPVRRRFEQHLISAINSTLKGLEYTVRRERGRIFVDTNSPATTAKRLTKVAGIVSVSSAVKVAADMDEIRSSALRVARKVLNAGMSFAVRTSRVGEHNFSTRDINVEIGSVLLSKIKGTRVNLSFPDCTIFIEIRGGDAYVFTGSMKGVGGLPVGTQGRAVVLFSSRRNDLAAAYLMIKRGCAVFPVFLDSRPNRDGRALKSTITSAKKLAAFSYRLELRVIPFGKVLTSLKKANIGELGYIIYRRSALRAAEAIAEQVGAEVIVAGDDAKDVATLKLANLGVIDEACGLSVLRPLAGVDINQMQRLEIKMPISSRVRVTNQFTPPTNIIKLDEVRKLECGVKIGAVIEESVSKTKRIKLR